LGYSWFLNREARVCTAVGYRAAQDKTFVRRLGGLGAGAWSVSLPKNVV
jgi:hypothetical protein